MKRQGTKKPNKNRLSPDIRREIVKVLYFFEHKNQTEIATEIGADKSTICRDLKKIQDDFTLIKLNIEELSAVIRFRSEKRQKSLFNIFTGSKNPYVKISCLRHMREEDRNLIDLLNSITSLRQNPVYQECKPLQLILEHRPPNRGDNN